MLSNDWLRGVKRTPAEFDSLVLRIINANPQSWWSARDLADRLASFNGQIAPDVHRTLRSMKRLFKDGKISLRYRTIRGWYGHYEGRYKNAR